jgi:hypothetical protein
MLKISNALDTIINNKFDNVCSIYLKDVTILKIKQWKISRKPTDTTNTLDKNSFFFIFYSFINE